MLSISGSSGRFAGTSMTKQSTPSAGIGQLPTSTQVEPRGKLLGNALPSAASRLPRIASAIVGIRTKVRRGQSQHHQHFACGLCVRNRFGRFGAGCKGKPEERDDEPCAQPGCPERHRLARAPSGSAKSTARSARSF
jgi:hypothetical protein